MAKNKLQVYIFNQIKQTALNISVKRMLESEGLSINQNPTRTLLSCLRHVENHYHTKRITSLQIWGTRWLHM